MSDLEDVLSAITRYTMPKTIFTRFHCDSSSHHVWMGWCGRSVHSQPIATSVPVKFHHGWKSLGLIISTLKTRVSWLSLANNHYVQHGHAIWVDGSGISLRSLSCILSGRSCELNSSLMVRPHIHWIIKVFQRNYLRYLAPIGTVTPRRVAQTSEYRVGKSLTHPKTNVCTRQSSISVF